MHLVRGVLYLLISSIGSITVWARVCVFVWLIWLWFLAVICLCIDEEPDPQRMYQLVANQMKNSYGLGTMLGLNFVQLSNIEGEYTEMVRRCMEVLKTWIKEETRTPVTWRTLITALREIEEIKVAGKIYREISQAWELGSSITFLCLLEHTHTHTHTHIQVHVSSAITMATICSLYTHKTIVTLFIIMFMKCAVDGTTDLCP